MNQPTIEEMRAALEATRLSPKEHFARMVADGLINSEGQLTKLYGGQAEPESWAKRPQALTSANVNSRREEPTIEDMRAALDATDLPPKENFERMVAIGLINSEGQLTKLYGGQAEPEPWAKRPPAVTSATVNGRRGSAESKKKRKSRGT